MELNLKITCPEKLEKALEEARNHYDTSLQECLTNIMLKTLRLGKWVSETEFAYDDGAYIQIFSDFGRDFGWVEVYSDGRQGIRGGIVCHGYKGEPDESFSVTMNREKVWQIHT